MLTQSNPQNSNPKQLDRSTDSKTKQHMRSQGKWIWYHMSHLPRSHWRWWPGCEVVGRYFTGKGSRGRRRGTSGRETSPPRGRAGRETPRSNSHSFFDASLRLLLWPCIKDSFSIGLGWASVIGLLSAHIWVMTPSPHRSPLLTTSNPPMQHFFKLWSCLFTERHNLLHCPQEHKLQIAKKLNGLEGGLGTMERGNELRAGWINGSGREKRIGTTRNPGFGVRDSRPSLIR
jgi:hypothetical protein